LPQLLKEKRLLTAAEYKEIMYIDMDHDELYSVNITSGCKPAVMKVSTNTLKEKGLLNRLVALREKLLHKDF